MATSRTGTTTWKNLRRAVIHEARTAGIRACPECGTTLNYDTGRLPASAEVDHIIPVVLGGKDTRENVRVICRRCNQSLGDKKHQRTKRVFTIARVEPHHTQGRTTFYTNGSSITNLIDW